MGSASQFLTWSDPSLPNMAYFYGGYLMPFQSAGFRGLWSLNMISHEWEFLGPEDEETPTIAPVYGPAPYMPSPDINPGSRVGQMSGWVYNSSLYLFGGFTTTMVADLWSYNIESRMWTWLGGQTEHCSPGNVGAYRVFDPQNVPPGRDSAITWQSPATPDLLWLHGGYTFGIVDDKPWNVFAMNDVSVYNVTSNMWAWVSGADINLAAQTGVNQNGIYTGEFPVPGSRSGHSVWSVGEEAYIFGGNGYDAVSTVSLTLNDLWKFNVVTWSWTYIFGCQDATILSSDSCCASSTAYPSCRGFQYVAKSSLSFPIMWIFSGEQVTTALDYAWAINVTNGEAVSSFAVAEQPARTVQGGMAQLEDGTPALFFGQQGSSSYSGAWFTLQVCEPGCLHCGWLGSPVCETCDTDGGYVLNPLTKACGTTCPDGFYLNQTIMSCFNCSFGCSVCTASGLSVDTCQTCDTAEGYVLSGDGDTCVNRCNNGEYKGSLSCDACTAGCAACNGTGLEHPSACQSCNNTLGYFLNANATMCVTCSEGEYRSSGEQCLPCSVGCEQCSGAGLSLFSACHECSLTEGYRPSLNGSMCVNHCGANQNATAVGCVCITGTYQANSACIGCTVGCAACIAPGLDPGSCSSCNNTAGFVSSPSGVCVSNCGSGWYKGATQCLPCSSGCASCSAHGLSQPACSVCNATLSYVWSADNTTCVAKCRQGYYKGQAQCEECSFGCAECTGAGLGWPAPCSACNETEGYVSDAASGSCVVGCPPGEYLAGDSCQPCNIGCANCTGPGLATTTCQTCNTSAGYLLALNGSVCVDGCAANEVEREGGCACSGAYYASADGCIACSNGCLTCTPARVGVPSACVTCQTDHVLIGGACELPAACSWLYRDVNNDCELNVTIIGAGGGSIVALLFVLVCLCWCRARARRGATKSPIERPLLDPAEAHGGYGTDFTRLSYDSSNNTLNVATIASPGGAGAAADGSKVHSIQLNGVSVTKMDDLEVLSRLGEGGFATVFKVRHRRNYTMMALKQFTQNSAEQVAQFVDEASVMYNLHHPCCLRCLGIVLDTDNPTQMGMLTEFMAGGDLASRMTQPMSYQEKLMILLKICQGLAYLHEQNLVHRDLKPGNVLLDGRGGVVVADFGLVKFHGHAFTPRYAPPEVARGAIGTTAADVYALGVLGLELLQIAAPNASREAQPGREQLEAVLTRCTEARSGARPALSEVLEVVAQHCTQ